MTAYDVAAALAALAEARAALLRAVRGESLAVLAGANPVALLALAFLEPAPPPYHRHQPALDDPADLLLAAWVAHQAALLSGDPGLAARVLERLGRELGRSPVREL